MYFSDYDLARLIYDDLYQTIDVFTLRYPYILTNLYKRNYNGIKK